MHYPKLLPLLVPDGWSFQHFIDGVLPKLVQAYDYLREDTEIKLLLFLWEPEYPIHTCKHKHVCLQKNIKIRYKYIYI